MAHRSKNVGKVNGRYIARGCAGEKTCSRCKTMQPLPSFVVDMSRFDGRGYTCEPCRGAKRTAPGPTVIERKAKAGLGLRWCRGCLQWLPEIGIQSGLCRPCTNAYTRSHYAKDVEFRVRRKHRSSARKRSLAVIPYEAQQAILEEFFGECAYCPSPAKSWDHVVPVVRGGLTEPYNIVPACISCNSSKNASDLWLWLAATGRQAKDQVIDRLVLYHCHAADGPDPFE